MQLRSTLLSLTCAVAAIAVSVGATPAPQATMSPYPQGGEVSFVKSIGADLNSRFPNPQTAEAAGYFRYTNVDEDGAISYVNLHWQSGNPHQPSQLWYDAKGNLLGADFSAMQSSSPSQPQVWGVDPRRWTSFREHIHYVLLQPDGTQKYGGVGAKKFAAAGGNVDDPKAETLVKMGIATSPDQVAHVFLFPSIWDLIVWVKPNPAGAFADVNPTVTVPSTSSPKPM
jgi:hypothetical protein